MKTAIIMLLAVFTALWAVDASAELPEIKKDCSICHESHSMGGGMLLKAPINELCLGCHAESSSGDDHAVGVVPKEGAGDLPLDKEGRITCATCHDPHGKTEFPSLLRAVSPQLCEKCHFFK